MEGKILLHKSIELRSLAVSSFQLTSDVVPGTVFFISAGFASLTLGLALYILMSLRGKKMAEVTAMGAGRVESAKPVPIFDTYKVSNI